jgi:hypothetical protein
MKKEITIVLKNDMSGELDSFRGTKEACKDYIIKNWLPCIMTGDSINFYEPKEQRG